VTALVTHNIRSQQRAFEVFLTPRNGFIPLLDKLPSVFLDSPVLDPSAGDGRMVYEIILRGNSNDHLLNDIWPDAVATWNSNPVLSSCQKYNIDFLELNISTEFPVLITNPPFTLATAFVEHAFALQCRDVFILQSLNWMATAGRTKFWTAGILHQLLVLPLRPKWELPNGGKTHVNNVTDYGWFWFKRGKHFPKRTEWLTQLSK
jgi:predicted RNA methylase